MKPLIEKTLILGHRGASGYAPENTMEAFELAAKMGLTPEQVGMKAGMLVCSVFPIIGTFVVIAIIRYFKKNKFEA